jgi:hypothetical protein
VIYVVLGMHKSGTTLVTRLLHESGIPMGEFDPRLGYGDGNTFERRDAQDANRALLRGLLLPPLDHFWRRAREPGVDRAGYAKNRDSQAWVRRRALARRLASPDAEPALRAVVEARAEDPSWGFKDPRTCLTYPAWRRVLPEHRLIVVYRGPAQLRERARTARHPRRALRVLQAWTVHNRAILEHLAGSSAPRIVLRYERLMDGEEEVARLSRFVGLPLKDTRERRLYRARQDAPLPGWLHAAARLLDVAPDTVERQLERLAS